MHDIHRLKLRITLDHPWLSALLYRLPLVPDDTIPTLCTDGREIRFSPKYLDSLTLDQAVGVMCHELLHVGFLHHSRRVNRESRRWNCATDYAVNALLSETGVQLPAVALLDMKYAGLTAEDIYDLLPPTPPDPLCELSAPRDLSDLSDLSDALTSCLHDAARRGIGSKMIDRLLDADLKPRVDWRDIFSANMHRIIGQDDYCARPSRRGLALDCVLPSLKSEAVSSVAMIIDTSGSMPDKELSKIVSDVRNCIDSIRIVDLLIIEADSQVRRISELSPGDDFAPLKLLGGGGTDFRPAIAEAEKRGINTIIYITDLDGVFPNSFVGEIIWLSHSDFVPPLGQKIKMGGKT